MEANIHEGDELVQLFEEWVAEVYESVPLDQNWNVGPQQYEHPQTHSMWLAFKAGYMSPLPRGVFEATGETK